MAGSYGHIATLKDEKLHFSMDLIENLRDAYGALEECFDMIEHLSGGDLRRLHKAHLYHFRKRFGDDHVDSQPKIFSFDRFVAGLRDEEG